MKVVFLTLDEILALHADQIDRYGGSLGVRDVGLLESALAAPAATFGGRYLHGSLHEMAAAHLFHLVQDHPFVDGNKRIGLMAMPEPPGKDGVYCAHDAAGASRGGAGHARRAGADAGHGGAAAIRAPGGRLLATPICLTGL